MYKRYNLLDGIRGFSIISMILYHTAWDLVYIFGIDWQWYKSSAAYIWQQSICWCFILISGFCMGLGKRHIKRGLIVFAAGAAVSIFTILFMPEQKIIFGIMTCIGSCMLITALALPLLTKINPYLGLVVNLLLFGITKSINKGIICGYSIPKRLCRSGFMTFLGFKDKGFFSADYFSIMPWIFLFLCGYFLYAAVFKFDSVKKFFCIKIPVLSFLGRHSLLIYIIHQPVVYAVLYIFFIIFRSR